MDTVEIFADISVVKKLERLAVHLQDSADATFVRVACGAPIRINVSVGATMLREGDLCDEILDRANRLMYARKGAGRNRVHFG